MPPALALLQQSMQALDEAIRAIPDPALVNTLTTCLSNMAAVQQKLMEGQGQQQQGAPPAGPPQGGPRQALVGQLGGY